MSQTRVLLAEDHPQMQAVIARLVAEKFEVIGVVSNGEQILGQVAHGQPDAIVLDVSLPGRSGLQVLPDLRTHYPHLAIVILTSHADPRYRNEALLRGADAYVLKGEAITGLLPAIGDSLSARRAIRHSEYRLA